MAKPRKATDPGLNQGPNDLLIADLARRYGRLNAIALRVAREELFPAIASGNTPRVELALAKIEQAMLDDLDDNQIHTVATNMGQRVNEDHERAFYAGLGVVLGVRFMAGDSPSGRPVRPDRRPGDMKRPRFIPRKNAQPWVLVGNYADRNVQYLSKLRNGAVAGMRQAVAQASVDHPDNGEAQAAALDADWLARGVPSDINMDRRRNNGLPVLLRLESHAHMIAGDEISRLTGDLNGTRMMAAGIDSAVWETRRDSRVRPQHREWQGQIFRWADGIGGVFPGEPYNCRCHARAILMEDRLRMRRHHIAIDEAPVDFDAVAAAE